MCSKFIKASIEFILTWQDESRSEVFKISKALLSFEVSSLEIPLSILQEKQIPLIESKEEQIIDKTKDTRKDNIILSETRILFDEIENLFDRYETEEQQKQSLLLQREKDLENARKRSSKT